MHGHVWRGARFVKSSPVAVKDGKDPHGPALTFERGEWSAFVQWASE
jgi:hypothetical protein